MGRTLDEIKADIEEKREQISEIEKEIKGLEKEAVAAARAVAKEFGFTLTKAASQPKKTASKPADRKKWIAQTVNANAGITLPELRQKYADEYGSGSKFRAPTYQNKKIIVIKGDNETVSLGAEGKKLVSDA